MLFLCDDIIKISVQFIKSTSRPARESVFLDGKQLLPKLQHLFSSIVGFNIHDDQITLAVFSKKNWLRSLSTHISNLVVILTDCG